MLVQVQVLVLVVMLVLVRVLVLAPALARVLVQVPMLMPMMAMARESPVDLVCVEQQLKGKVLLHGLHLEPTARKALGLMLEKYSLTLGLQQRGEHLQSDVLVLMEASMMVKKELKLELVLVLELQLLLLTVVPAQQLYYNLSAQTQQSKYLRVDPREMRGKWVTGAMQTKGEAIQTFQNEKQIILIGKKKEKKFNEIFHFVVEWSCFFW